MEDSLKPVWNPGSKTDSCQMDKFRNYCEKKSDNRLPDWESLYRWSIDGSMQFWEILADFFELNWHFRPEWTYRNAQPDKMWNGDWFGSGRLNYAEHLLSGDMQQEILVAIQEDGTTSRFTRQQLRKSVAKTQHFLKERGVGPGDRVGGVVRNDESAIILMLATTSLGAVWASCSPDFGVSGILDRFTQIKPSLLLFSSEYKYNGKLYKMSPVAQQIQSQLADCQVILLSQEAEESQGLFPFTVDEINSNESATFERDDLYFHSTQFSDPLFILFSSGTTGKPKCIVHSVGGTLLQHLKEHRLHCDLDHQDTLFYFTTCGWMMWNWMVSALGAGSKIVTFDGSPGFPDLNRLWEIIEKEQVSVFGTSPKFLSACQKNQIDPRGRCKSLRLLLSTGAPLVDENYRWILDSISRDLQIGSISGGTDLISCFVLCNPLLPVYKGKIQSPGLGMKVECWNHSGESVLEEKGELVCTLPFVSMPIGFWGDEKKLKYRAAYFQHYPESGESVWRHGDFIEVSKQYGILIHGRSDSTLNPGGIRIGTAEIYRLVEAQVWIADSIVVGLETSPGEVEVVLFVELAESQSFDLEKVQQIKKLIRDELTPRHVPAKVFQVPSIPYTRSGKKLELAVRSLLLGKKPDNIQAVKNPEAFEFFRKLGSNRDWIQSN